MGLAILLESGRSSELDFARALRPLSIFGLVHGCHEWLEMFLIIEEHNLQQLQGIHIIDITRILLLVVSFTLLIAFGFFLLVIKPTIKQNLLTFGTIITLWCIGLLLIFHHQISGHEKIIAADVFTRYSLAIPGSILCVWGLITQRKRFINSGMKSFGDDMLFAAIAFGIYGGIGQLFASPSNIFPSQFFNNQTFTNWFGFPIQVLRAIMAFLVAIFIIRSLRAFEEEYKRNIAALQKAQQREQQRLEALRKEMLHRTVKAQETERQRIAKELHDETGQTLTAIGLGLKSLSEMIITKPQEAKEQAKELQQISSQSIIELQRLVKGLHPPQLDDLGLISALHWYIDDIMSRTNININMKADREISNLPSDVRIVLFRIVQEAITNVVRHSEARNVFITLRKLEKYLDLIIEDDGHGFIVSEILNARNGKQSWGLFGMIERAALINGKCDISSAPNKGTMIQVQIPLSYE